MKSKITIPISLFLLTFVFSSYKFIDKKSENVYFSIKHNLGYNNKNTNSTTNTESCSKCHDCSGQNNYNDTLKFNLNPVFNDWKENKTIIEKDFSLTNQNENTYFEVYLYPDYFKNSNKN